MALVETGLTRGRESLGDRILTSAKGKILAAGGYVGRAMFFNSCFMGHEMAEKIIHGEGLEPGRDGGDEGVIVGTQTGEQVEVNS